MILPRTAFHKLDRRRFGTAGLALAVLIGTAAPAARAETWPSRPLQIVVPFAAGGTVDNVARVLQEPLRARLGQPVIVNNRPGGGGTIGTSAVAKAAADGYTVGLVFDSFATEQHIYRKLPYAARDLTGIATLVRAPMVLVVPASSPYTTLDAFIVAARQAGKVTFASVGAGSSNHLAGELFFDAVGGSGVHVPFKGGGPAITDLVGGHVDSMIASLPLVRQYLDGGQLRALAITSPQRHPALPNVPAVAERAKGFEIHSWVGMVAPAAMPPALIERLGADVAAALRQPAVQKQLEAAGFEVTAGPRSAMDALVRGESERWGRLIRARNIAAE
ncbi:tripartite tricarboxylate transporter substrate binding protein [Azohydromonas aeria]|uniref:tripartite tricarboxylate transporter substrate binding protein n=1 Tax=Azohydromonas aeria TaxID=2590212 RepID=UPI0012F95822|nr:tripartite tricarboxylate transporter substrate binding protein [Azohydromonas aeria]